jgi:hypothetical protein
MAAFLKPKPKCSVAAMTLLLASKSNGKLTHARGGGNVCPRFIQRSMNLFCR